jgi:nitric oxide reductase activation protein
MTFNREQLDERSQKTSKVLLEVQQQAELLGNRAQLEHMKQRLNASQTSLQEGRQERQETSGGGTKRMTHLYSTSEPSVNIVTDAETGELLENRKCFISTMKNKEKLHNF